MSDPEPAAEPDLDRSILEELSAGDRAFEEEMLSLFVDSATHSANLLGERLAGDGWRDHAHKLKGAAEAVGARRLAGLAGKAMSVPIEPAGERAALLTEINAALAALRKICAG